MTDFFNGQLEVLSKDVRLGMLDNEIALLLGIDENEIFIAGNNISYFTLDDIKMFELSCSCCFLFQDRKLISMTFTPSLKEYIKLCIPINRDKLYACVDQGYKHLIGFLECNFKFDISQQKDKFSRIFTYGSVDVIVEVDRDHENVNVLVRHLLTV